MKLQTLAAACMAASFLAAPAFAGEAVTAKLSAPLAEKTKVIAGGAMFFCDGDTCVAAAPTSQTTNIAACRTLTDKVGPVAAYGGKKAFDEARLADCNERALAKAASGTQLAKQ